MQWVALSTSCAGQQWRASLLLFCFTAAHIHLCWASYAGPRAAPLGSSPALGALPPPPLGGCDGRCPPYPSNRTLRLSMSWHKQHVCTQWLSMGPVPSADTTGCLASGGLWEMTWCHSGNLSGREKLLTTTEQRADVGVEELGSQPRHRP